MGRKISPVTERRRARRAARELCKAEGKRVKAWVPSERKRVAGLIVQMRAHGQQQLAQLRAQTAEVIKLEREELTKRIKAARAAAKLGKCVDMTAGPQIAMYAYPKKPAHLKRGGQQRMFSSAPLHSGGKLGAPFRVRGELIANEKAAHAAVLRHLKHDQGGIVVLELADGAGGYVDGPYYGLQGEGKAASIYEVDPLDPHGHEMGRAQKHPRYGSGLRSVLPSNRPSSPKRSSRPPKNEASQALARSAGWKADRNLERERKRRAAKSRVPGAGSRQQYAGEIAPAAYRVKFGHEAPQPFATQREAAAWAKQCIEQAQDGAAVVEAHEAHGRYNATLAYRWDPKAHALDVERVPRGARFVGSAVELQRLARGERPWQSSRPPAPPSKRGKKGYSTIPPRHSSAPPPAKRSSAPPKPKRARKSKALELDHADRKALELVHNTMRTQSGAAKTSDANIAHHRASQNRGALKPIAKWLELDDYDLGHALLITGPAALEGARNAIRTEMRWEEQHAPKRTPKKRKGRAY